MNMRTKVGKPTAIPSTASILAKARQGRGYSLEDLAETTGLTVAEVTSLEVGGDFDPARVRRVAAALGVVDAI
jgi:transcriptional regulator with XRE-family HTH domain